MTILIVDRLDINWKVNYFFDDLKCITFQKIVFVNRLFKWNAKIRNCYLKSIFYQKHSSFNYWIKTHDLYCLGIVSAASSSSTTTALHSPLCRPYHSTVALHNVHSSDFSPFSAAFYSLLATYSLSLSLSFVSFLFSLVHFAGFSSFDLLTYFCFYDTSRIRIIIWYNIKASLLPMLLSLRISRNQSNMNHICYMLVWWLILFCIHMK